MGLHVTNPYQPSSGGSTLETASPVTDALIQQLIAGSGIEDLVFYDVSDCQLYGRKHLRPLTGEFARSAVDAGCEPVVFQSVLWLTLVFIPVWPLGVYVVLPRRECDDPDGDAEQYRGLRVPWDENQIAYHYLITFVLVLTAGCGVGYWLWLR